MAGPHPPSPSPCAEEGDQTRDDRMHMREGRFTHGSQSVACGTPVPSPARGGPRELAGHKGQGDGDLP